MIASLLDGIVVHAVRGDPVDYARLESDMTSLRNRVSSEHLDSGDLLIATGAGLKALQDYNRRTTSSIHAQSVELQKITSMLTETIVNLSVSGSTNVSRLQELERQLETAVGLEDVRMLKEKLSECLIGLREEKLRQKAASQTAVENLSENLRSARSGVAPTPAAVDSVTGLNTRQAAENAIAMATDGSGTVYAILFVIDHMNGLIGRFGSGMGDRIFMIFAQHLAQHLQPEDQVFRWSGPAFLALLAREIHVEALRRELVPLTKARLELTVESRGRSVLLPINFCWTLVPVPHSGMAGPLVDNLDRFLASKVGITAEAGVKI